MHAFDGQTDGQTDRQTDRNLIVKTALHSMQRGKNFACHVWSSLLNIRRDYQFVFSVLDTDKLYPSPHAWWNWNRCRSIRVWNVMFYFHKVAYVQYLDEVDIFHTWVKNFPSLQRCKNYKNRSRFLKVMITNVLPVCHLFMVHNFTV